MLEIQVFLRFFLYFWHACINLADYFPKSAQNPEISKQDNFLLNRLKKSHPYLCCKKHITSLFFTLNPPTPLHSLNTKFFWFYFCIKSQNSFPRNTWVLFRFCVCFQCVYAYLQCVFNCVFVSKNNFKLVKYKRILH